jgi:serine/threonine protein kinase/formylglycine-generating enzyme required for sulfatase activity/dienelactone hydrolase
VANEGKDEEAIFNAAIRLKNSVERDAYLAGACGDDDKLRTDVQALVQAHEAKSLLDIPIFDPDVTLDDSPLTEGSGTVIGRYKLLEEIGEGGMAVVYMAQQEKPIRRRVALKIIKLGMDTKQVIARFEAERQALAVMNHPNIAKVFDAGATETGRPYFVMELVRGISITEYCDKNKLSTAERLGLFLQVCNAVQHAHQKGIIHRDLKPLNVMVTLHDGTAVPKVIDFGIAKAINQRLTEKTLFTRYAQMIGTPAYMSPEQAEMSGLDVDTRTDIYSLGVLLYELLTGTPPFDAERLHSAGYLEMQKIIREEEPTKPSTKLSALRDSLTDVAKHRNTKPDLLRKLIRGDLDWIVMKSLEKDRTRRYETVNSLIMDIQRHLKHEPILAGSPGAIYRLQKFVRRHRSRIVATAAATVLFAGLIFGTTAYVQNRRVRWARNVALPVVVKLFEQDDYLAAFSLATKAEKYIPYDPVLVSLWPHISRDHSITTTPSGAEVYYKEYSDIEGEWQYLGRSPMENIRFPRGVYRWKIEKQGFETRQFVADKSLNTELWEEGSLPPGMVRIPQWTATIGSASTGQIEKVKAPVYLIDKYEVTNEQFKGFVDAGGYQKQEYWQHKLVKEGRELSWEQAMREFRDKMGQPGPATWQAGTYPNGQGKHPVSGVSWYEAVAYAEFVGKSLPTAYHWERAACLNESLVIVPFSNFGAEGTVSVGSSPGMGHTGLYDMAGNVKEWCFNATDDSGSHRYALGGGWGEPTYLFTERDSRSTWDRSPLNGFRCVQYLGGEETVATVLFGPLEQRLARDLSNLVPFSDGEFRTLKANYEYDRTPLNAVIEGTDDNSPFWRKEKITFDAAYGGERMIAYLFLPKAVKPPYQTVIYFPGVGAVYKESFNGLPQRDLTEYVIMSGRALLFPVYKGTYERPAARGRVWTIDGIVQTPLAYRDWTIQMAKDLSRSIDYLETRDDIDSERVAYYGMSWGAANGPIMLAVEERLDTGIFVVGGIPPVDLPRSIDIALYAQRVKAPVLMVNGREDVGFPYESSQIPMYELLGTADEHKEHKLYPGGHGLFGLFSKQIEQDVLGWLDRYLGPVE